MDDFGLGLEKNIEIEVLEFIDKVDDQESVNDLNELFLNLIEQFGYKHFRCGQVFRPGLGIEPRMIFGSIEDEWSIHYREREYLFSDSTVQHGLISKYPFFWSDQKERDRVNMVSKRMFDEAANDFQLGDGLVVPIHDGDNSVSLVSIIGETPMKTDEVRRGLGLAAVYLHGRALELKDSIKYDAPKGADRRVTKRQLDCLQWVAEGKSDWEISQILKISEFTVHNHVEGAKRVLGVNTRVQAVVAASRRRLFVL